MDEKKITQIELRLEKWIEGFFSGIFRRQASPQDLAIQLSRSMKTNLMPAQDGDPRQIAPDEYTIRMHPNEYARFLQKDADMIEQLSTYMVELAQAYSVRLINHPLINIVSDERLKARHVVIETALQADQRYSTSAMRPVKILSQQGPQDPVLFINNQVFKIKKNMIRIGSADDNDVVVQAKGVINYHLQLRLRFEEFWLFNLAAPGYTAVNGTMVKEQLLQNGDIIQIGQAQIVYQDSQRNPSHNTTEHMNPVNITEESE
ncbi:hypothetical protein MASR2M15_19350 [Anaerolineales bacterium]